MNWLYEQSSWLEWTQVLTISYCHQMTKQICAQNKFSLVVSCSCHLLKICFNIFKGEYILTFQGMCRITPTKRTKRNLKNRYLFDQASLSSTVRISLIQRIPSLFKTTKNSKEMLTQH